MLITRALIIQVIFSTNTDFSVIGNDFFIKVSLLSCHSRYAVMKIE